MSWSVWNVAVPEAGVPQHDTMNYVMAAIDRTAEDSPTYRAQLDVPEVKDQVIAAACALDELIASGAVGKGPWTANLSGHANPGHERGGDYGAESINVTLTNATPTGQPMATTS